MVYDVAQKLGLSNVKAECVRSELLTEKYDFVTSRAVAPALSLIEWNKKNLSKKNKNNIPNGFLFLKGGDLREELEQVNYKNEVVQITDYFETPFFAEEKKLVYIHGF